MDPELGRFISLDPELGSLSAPQSMNRYVYCVNNPLRYTDPTGWKTFVPRHQESDMNFDEFMYAIGFVPFIGDVSDAYFLIKYAYEKDWTNLGITAAGAALPFIGGSYLRSGRQGADWLGSQFVRHADDVPVAPALRNADDLGGAATFFRVMDEGGYAMGKSQGHHLLPRAFREFFESHGIRNIDNHVMGLDENVHRMIHGKHMGPLDTQYFSWNSKWGTWIGQNPGAEADEILTKMKSMMSEFSL